MQQQMFFFFSIVSIANSYEAKIVSAMEKNYNYIVKKARRVSPRVMHAKISSYEAFVSPVNPRSNFWTIDLFLCWGW